MPLKPPKRLGRIAQIAGDQKKPELQNELQNKKARTNAGLSKFWLLDLGSNQGPTD
jgi:hypothetical protein